MKQLRERVKVSQEELARAVEVSVSTVQKWDQGRSFPQMKPVEMLKLKEVLECTWDELTEAQQHWIEDKEKASD